MEREVFERRFLAASVRARDFGRTFIEEPLPDAMRFRLRLNSSYDGTAAPKFKLFPGDAGLAATLRTRVLSAGEVIDVLWRDGQVPQWVDLAVVGETDAATVIEVLACGRFIADETALYYTWTDLAPFSPKGPSLPADYVEGRRFSIHHRSSCWSREDLACTMLHASKLWSLDLHGPAFDDEVLAAAVASASLEILELHGSALRGPGLAGLARLPRLRVLRLNLIEADALSLTALPRVEGLQSLSIQNLPRSVSGIGALAVAAPSLTSLSLAGTVDTVSDATANVPMLTELHLTFPHVPSWIQPGPSLRTLSLHAQASSDREVAALLAKVPAELENLHLRGTAVSDAVLDALAPFHKLRYLDVVDTGVTTEGMQRFTAARPSLRFHPRPRKA